LEHRLLTIEEELDIFHRAAELDKAGLGEEARELRKAIPLPPYMAKVIKEKVGADFLLQRGYNLAAAEIEYGSGWINRQNP